MSFRTISMLVVAAVTLTSAQQPNQIPTPGSEVAGPSFMLRVDPRWAEEVNTVLARVARPVEIELRAMQTASEFLARACGGRATAVVSTTRSSAPSRVLVAPCVRLRKNLKVEVTEGDTLEGLAVRSGLPRTAAGRLKVMVGGDSSPVNLSEPKALKVGDVVIVPEAPIWTSFEVDPRIAPDRAALVEALARAVSCGAEDRDACLLAREVRLLERATRTYVPPHPEPPDVEGFSFAKKSFDVNRSFETALRRSLRFESSFQLNSAASAALAMPSDSQQVHPVHSDQWPYDRRQLAALLKASANRIAPGMAIGVADAGLATLDGGPLAPDLFAPGPEKLSEHEKPNDPPEPDTVDDDWNDYIDDLFGAGVQRNREFKGTGDLSLCKERKPDFATWKGLPLQQASHGLVVSSIAAGLPLRRASPDVASLLPRLVFFRLLADACIEDANFALKEGELVAAFDYMKDRRDIGVINFSYTIDSATGKQFALNIKSVLPHRHILLVLPAGNDTPGDLDRDGNCPQCLGNALVHRGDTAAKRTLVVGSATRDLHRSSFSNFGPQTVGIFAPGEPFDAVDLASRPLSEDDAATSFAAPLAALAAGIIRSFDLSQTPMDLKDRLAATTWPLDDPDSGPEATRVGVVDLLKAAAVRHHAVEVLEPTAAGGLVRRTYVGTLLTPLKELSLCQGVAPFSEFAVHAIRLGPAAGDGERVLRIHRRKSSDDTQVRIVETQRCRPSGTLRLQTLLDGEKAFPLSDVTAIQLRWLLN